ncbi:putative glycosyl transferase [Cardiosporidium cionae]|uniref:UDP-N-acetylglucosamine transferase subunit ALG14 n=1 Tax=Cardiosporidium cionae TaxID=476202 RepID=A0ABQ7JBM4_9APIC|nr:putative glycosyl transferase [Cardiosporidium cionae]|eukprot:KAF8821406.1 putative glycosyl transferase [Cardiosporidium cionae]
MKHCFDAGGHTTEMTKLIQDFDFSLFEMHVVVAGSDASSKKRFLQLLSARHNTTESEMEAHFIFHSIIKCRHAGQSAVCAIIPTILSLFSGSRIFLKVIPDLIIVNGPDPAF